MSTALTLVELHAVEADYWYEVDHHYGRSASQLYEPDGTFAIGDQIFRGREAIAGFYRWREERGARTARHVIANPRVSRVTAEAARFECIMLLYAADGVPVLNSQPAIMIADVVTEYVRAGEGWKARSRNLDPVFEGGVGATRPPASVR